VVVDPRSIPMKQRIAYPLRFCSIIWK
jgi:hypothetical protein